MAPARHVLSLRLPEQEKIALERLARRLGRSSSELAARMLLEGRRRAEFAWIDFRDAAAGRQACLQGSRVPVWWIARLARQLGNEPERAADHLGLPLAHVRAAMNYAEAFPDEIDALIRDHESLTLDELRRQLPQIEVLPASSGSTRKARR